MPETIFDFWDNEDRWWDTVPQAAVDELHIRQHPYHNPKKPRVECPLCREHYGYRLSQLMNKHRPQALPSIKENNEQLPMYVSPKERIKRRMSKLSYWNES